MRIGITTPIRGCSVKELRELALSAESAGFAAIFSPEVPIYSAIGNAVNVKVISKIAKNLFN